MTGPEDVAIEPAERAERSLKNGIMVYRVSYPQCEILHTGG